MHERLYRAIALPIGRVGWRLHITVLLGVACALLLMLWSIPAHHVFAGSEGNITFSPSSGPVGTQVSVEIRLFPTTAQAYLLSATSTEPTQGSCSSAQFIPGAGSVTVGPQGGFVQFNWPSAFASGQYWLCASPQNGSGATAQSNDPFTVTAASSATPTATPGKGQNTGATISAFVVIPNGGAPAGSTITVVVSNWSTPNHAAPTSVALVPNSGNSTPVPLSFTATNNTGGTPDSFNLAVKLPATTPPGKYNLVIGDTYQLTTEVFQVIAPATPAPVTSVGPTSSGPGGISPVIIVAAVAGLLLIALILLITTMLSRRRAEALRRQQEEQMRRRAGDASASNSRYNQYDQYTRDPRRR